MQQMGLRVSSLRTAVQRGAALCCRAGRLEAAQRRQLVALAPPLAVRAGVGATEAEEAATEPCEHVAGQERPWQKKQKREKKPPPPRPTHFLALQVSQHEGVTGAIAAVQAALTAHSPHLKKACVEAASAHLTLGVMALPGEEQKQAAAAALAALADALEAQALLEPVEINLEGLSHFRNQVLYLDLRQDQGLQRLLALAAASRAHFQAAGLLLEAERAFVPHVTVAKTSKLQGFGGRGGGGRCDHGGRGHHGQHGGGQHGEHNSGSKRDWKTERREERRAKQQRLELQAADEEAAAQWGAEAPAAAIGESAEAAELESSAGEGAVAPGRQVPGSNSSAAANAEQPSSSAAAATGALEQQQRESPEDCEELQPLGLVEGLQEQQPPQPHHHRDRVRRERGHWDGDPAEQQQLNWRQIDAEAWAPLVAIEGGSALLAEIQLCAMQGRKPGGYYPVIASLPLASAVASAVAAGASNSGEQQQQQPGGRSSEAAAMGRRAVQPATVAGAPGSTPMESS